MGRQSGLVGSKLDSRSKGCGFESRPIQNKRWKWDESNARIDSCTQFWFIADKIRKIQIAKWGTPKNKIIHYHARHSIATGICFLFHNHFL